VFDGQITVGALIAFNMSERSGDPGQIAPHPMSSECNGRNVPQPDLPRTQTFGTCGGED
jgi:hypothetical protein